MGLLDDALRQLTQGNQIPQGNQTPQPGGGFGGLADVIQDLLQGKAPGSGAAPQPAPQAAPQPVPDGLAGLIAKLEAAGLGDQVKSWVGTGQNQPVAPSDLGAALGKKTVTQMANQCGVQQDDLLSQLAKALPVIIDKLTVDGRVPTQKAG